VTYYFAYGSNMNPKQMEQRLGRDTGWVDLGEAWLDGWSMVFAGWSNSRGGAPANVIRDREESTLGVLYQLAPGQLGEMDRFEGYPTSYERKRVTVKSFPHGRASLLEPGKTVKAWIYFKRNAAEGRPPRSYLLDIVRAYRRLGYVLESPWLGQKERR